MCFLSEGQLKENTRLTLEHKENAACAMGTAVPAATCHPNALQRRKMSLIPLCWCQDQDVHELPTWFTLTPETRKTSAIGCFIKGVRRSVADHSKFTEAKQWQQWDGHLQSAASAQGVDDVFNPSCVPSTDEEQALFVEQQKFGRHKPLRGW
jgi:hypothetical protein